MWFYGLHAFRLFGSPPLPLKGTCDSLDKYAPSDGQLHIDTVSPKPAHPLAALASHL